MRIKSYFADSVQDAIAKARVELGADAMILNSKRTDLDLANLGAYEVVFGVSQETGGVQGSNAPQQTLGSAGSAATETLDLGHEVSEMRKQLDSLRRSVMRTEVNRPSKYGFELQTVIDQLNAADLSVEWAQEIVEAVERRMGRDRDISLRTRRSSDGGFSGEPIEALVREEIESRIEVSPEIGSAEKGIRAIMLVGPPGSGKTTTLIKLALEYGLKCGKQPAIISTDTFRIGGAEQLAAYARITGIPFEAVQSLRTLRNNFEDLLPQSLVFIDTPGYSKDETDDMETLASDAADLRVEAQLVLPATACVSAALASLNRYKTLRPTKVIFSHVDEMETPGPMIEIAGRSGLPMSFWGCGQQVPEDIREASKAELSAMILPRRRAAVVSAA